MSEYILEMTNIEKQFPGVKALDKANLMLKKEASTLLWERMEQEKVH